MYDPFPYVVVPQAEVHSDLLEILVGEPETDLLIVCEY